MQMNGSPQMQMPVVNGQSQMAMPNGQQADVRLLMQAQRIQEQQRQSVQMRQQQGHQGSPGGTPMQNSPQAMRAALGGLNQKNYLNNAQAQAMLASMNGANGTDQVEQSECSTGRGANNGTAAVAEPAQ
ncbi:hypothetical protein DL762_009872 [Monosporascus cannonballus]|uniref:Uncharacterized protein n=1 Tax=Monosporascus cannonballus TaxID=155416 RepID=A0ABY0GW51_9PEZI|nr:hypothetical protein DL762_009872 [Monosporascus cannonballus]